MMNNAIQISHYRLHLANTGMKHKIRKCIPMRNATNTVGGKNKLSQPDILLQQECNQGNMAAVGEL